LEREKLGRPEAEETSIDTQAGTLLIQEPEVGLARIDEQTRALLRTVVFIFLLTGLWLIWDSVFPAFGILQDVHLWSYSSVVDGAATAIPITLADVVLSILITALTLISAKNLPGLLEITLLNRLPMDPGARYAFIRVSRYTITAIGIILAVNTIGLQWAKLQWLIAALGVGLGFGLQEIVANFINNINNWYPVVHELNRQINREFKKAGITISFPQRDVHLDASSPLEIRVVSGTS